MEGSASQRTLQVVFRPARNGTGVVCRLPSGKIAFPSRFYWNQPDPQPYEIWRVLPCGETERVGYVKPLERLAAAPFRNTTRRGRLANRLVARLGETLAATVRHWRHVRRQGRLQPERITSD